MLRRALALLALIICVGTVAPLRAEDPQEELRFIQELRARGHADLALEYMDTKLSKKAADALKEVLPLEKARCRMARADQEIDSGKRQDDYKRAQEEFEAFLKGKPSDAQSAEANLELARVAAAQGKLQFRKALGEEDDEVRPKELDKARGLFQIAETRLKTATTQIQAQLDKLSDAKTDEEKARKRTLLRARQLADFERGIDSLQKGLTMNDVVQRGKTIEEEAIGQLDKVAGDAENPYRWEARAWLVRCHGEVDKVKPAKREYANVMNTAAGPGADKAKRLALYFYIRLIPFDQDVKEKEKAAESIKLAEAWLRTYPTAINTPEGNGVRFRLAKAYTERARNVKNPRAPEALKDFKEARNLFKILELSGSEYAGEARREKIRIVLTLAENKGDINQLTSFEECFLEAQREMYLMSEEQKQLTAARKQLAAGPTDKAAQELKAKEKKFEDDQKVHYKKITAAINRALELPADPEVTPKEVIEARSILAYAYLEQGQLYPAAILAEELAHSDADSDAASAAASYALQAYVQLVTKDHEAISRLEQLPDGDADRQLLPMRQLELRADGGRLRKLASYMEQKWPDNPVTDFARHQLAFTLLREQNFPEAMDVLGRITTGYNNYAYTRYQIALAADEVIKKGTKKDGSKLTDADKKALEDRALAALKSIPELTANVDPYSAQIYVLGKLKLGQIYFRGKQYDQVESLANQLDKLLAGPKFDRTREELRPGVESLLMSAKYARILTAHDAGNLTKVAEFVAAEMARLEGMVDKQSGKLPELKDRELIRGILGIGIRASIELGKTAEANRALNLLQKTAGEGESTTAILVPVAQQIRKQIEELQKKGPSAEAQLKKTKESFTKFLDELAKQPAKSLSGDILVFLAQSYASLDEHNKAVEVLQRLPKPSDDPKAPAAQEAVPRAGYVLLGRELRLAGKLPESEKVLESIRKTAWGKQNLQALMEWPLLLMDQGKLTGKGGAIQEWNGLLKALQPRLLDERTKDDFKQPYYDCYFNFAKCYLLNGKKISSPVERKKWIGRAAQYIATAQTQADWGTELTRKRFEELLAQEPELKAEYDGLKPNETKSANK